MRLIEKKKLPVPVPPPKPHVRNIICEPRTYCITKSKDSSAAFAPTSALEPAPIPIFFSIFLIDETLGCFGSQMNYNGCFRDGKRLNISVTGDEFNASQFRFYHIGYCTTSCTTNSQNCNFWFYGS